MVFGENPLKDLYRRAIWGPWRRTLEAAPPGVELVASRALGGVAWTISRNRRDLLRNALRDALGDAPDLDQHVRKLFETHFCNQYIGFSFAKITADNWETYLDLRGREHLNAALAAGRGVVVAHAHMGLPQLPLHALGVQGVDVHQVGGGRTAVELSAVGRWAADTRASLEDRIAATMHDGRAYVRPILRALGRGGVVFTACDGTGGGEELGRRVDVDMLGRTFQMPVFPVWLAQKSGATLLYLRTWREGRAVAAFEAPIEVSSEQAGVREVARRLEAAVRAHPGDWHFWDAWHDREGGLLR